MKASFIASGRVMTFHRWAEWCQWVATNGGVDRVPEGEGGGAVRTLRLTLRFLARATVIAGTRTAPAAAADQGLGFDLESATIPDLQQRMDHGRLTSVALTGAYLN